VRNLKINILEVVNPRSVYDDTVFRGYQIRHRVSLKPLANGGSRREPPPAASASTAESFIIKQSF
jgi:hypothetical protein